MKLLLITVDYPDDHRIVFPFVKNLVEALAERGNECAVIAPYSVTHNRRFYKRVRIEKTPGGASVTVIRPPFLSVSNLKIGKARLSDRLHKYAVRRGLRYVPFKPDAIYGHFWSSAYEGYEYSKLHSIPLFVASGESVIADSFTFSIEVEPFCDYVRGVICVSSKNKDESVRMGLTTPDKCIVIPNAVDSSFFKKMDKALCRQSLGIERDDFVVIFIGWFNNRKGVLRVSSAIKRMNDSSVKSLFIGSGDQDPNCDGILFKDAVIHNEIPKYLNAADVFVLPTLQEGCCNAVVEALSCGVPVISSDRAFNWDVLDETNSLLIDPEDISQISDAIAKLKDDVVLRAKLSIGALKKAEDLSISKRAERIESFIENRISNNV